MKKFASLVRLLFIQQFKSMRGRTKDKKKRSASVLLGLLIALVFGPILVGFAVGVYYIGKIAQGDPYIGTFLMLLCQGVVMMFGVHAIISNVFVVKDAEKLLYLPMRAYTIFLAKMTVAYINELITSAVTVLVTLLPFALGANLGFGYYLMLPVAMVLVPLFPMLIGALIAMPIAALITAFGKNSIVKTVLRILLYVAIMALYMYLMYGFGFLAGSESGNFFESPEVYVRDMLAEMHQNLQSVMPYFHSDYMLMYGMTAVTFGAWAKGFAASLGENILLICAVFAISLPFYRRMLAMSVEEGGSRRRIYGRHGFKMHSRGVVRELMNTDFNRTMRDSQTGFQSFAGIIMMPLIVVLMYFIIGISGEGESSFLQVTSISNLYQAIAPLVIMAYLMFIGVCANVLGVYPISRENRGITILKSLPVPFSKILLSKVLLATAVMMVSDFLACLLTVVLFGIRWYIGIAMLVTIVLVGFGAMCVTTLIDLKSPNICWENFNQGLKNQKNSWLAMLVSMLAVLALVVVSVPFIVLYVLFGGGWYWMLAMWLVNFGLGAGFAAIAYKVMAAKASGYFDRIEV